jgi:hypothetical protein
MKVMIITNIELIKACQENINIHPSNSEIVLILSGRMTKSGYKSICGIKGECTQETGYNEVICIFPATELKNAIEKHPEILYYKCDEYKPQIFIIDKKGN